MRGTGLTMSEQSTTGPAKRKPTTKDTVEGIATEQLNNEFVPEWATGFDNEDYPDVVMVGETEKLFFEVIDSNIIPLRDKRTGDLVETEVVQVLVMAGSSVTEKLSDGDDGEFVSTGEKVPVGEIRSLWINCALLKKIWITWQPDIGDEGALVYTGKRKPKSGGTPYQHWIGKFNKTPHRQSSVR